MKRFTIFRKGRHTASSGATLDFGEEALRAAVAAYDPTLHEAPIVVGHPKDNAPAYGWVGSMSFSEDTGEIEVDPAQVDADFAEMVSAGRFKKRSASWYLPDSPANPKPGTLYLRHVAFLGAQPPAVKGLKDVSFAEEAGTVTFSEDYDRWAWGTMASLFRGLRDWLIADKGLDTADKLLPNYALTELDDVAKRAREQGMNEPAAQAAFSEDDPMKIEELQAQVAKLTADLAAAKANAKPADFSEREAALAAREAKIAESEAKATRAAIEARVDAAVKAGRLLPSQRKHAVDFAMSLADGEAVIDFGEGDKAKKLTQREAYLAQIEASQKVVEYREVGAGGDPAAGEPDSVAAAQATLMAQVTGAAKAAK